MNDYFDITTLAPFESTQPIPWSFEWEITARCNLNCRHCYINCAPSDASALSKELSAGHILDIAAQAVELGSLWCLITGGEPLLRKDFEVIYIGLKKMGLLVSLFTNATLITDKHAALFRQYPPRDLEISVYGASKDTYEAITRTPGSYDRFRNGLQRLDGIPFRLKSVIMRSNLHEAQELKTFCEQYSQDYYRFDPHLCLRFDRNPARNREIIAERLTPEEVATLESADPDRLAALCNSAAHLDCEEFVQRTTNHLFHCGAGENGFTVGYDGTFRLCSGLWAEGTTYDLKTGSLQDAWRNFAPAVRNMRTQQVTYQNGCLRCRYINLCMSCPAHTDLESGRMDDIIPYYCEVAKQRAAIFHKKA